MAAAVGARHQGPTAAGVVMQVIWSPTSLRQIEEIHDYITRDNPIAAVKMQS
jgi:hypothetical protein